MANVEIYTWSTCMFCKRAKALLDSKNVRYAEYDITNDDAARAKMSQRAGGRTSVPQIFINNSHIGGNDDLHALEAQGKLDPLLNG